MQTRDDGPFNTEVGRGRSMVRRVLAIAASAVVGGWAMTSGAVPLVSAASTSSSAPSAGRDPVAPPPPKSQPRHPADPSKVTTPRAPVTPTVNDPVTTPSNIYDVSIQNDPAGPPASTCKAEPGDSGCSLRQAIAQANFDGSAIDPKAADEIKLTKSGIYQLDPAN